MVKAGPRASGSGAKNPLDSHLQHTHTGHTVKTVAGFAAATTTELPCPHYIQGPGMLGATVARQLLVCRYRQHQRITPALIYT